GFLAESDGGVVIIPMAERLEMSSASQIVRVLDRLEVVVERDGLSSTYDARIAVAALDEGLESDDAVPDIVSERLAFRCDLSAVSIRDVAEGPIDNWVPDDAADRVQALIPSQEHLEELAILAQAFGVSSLRALQFAARTAAAHAVLEERSTLEKADLLAAARLVIAPRATQIPTMESEPEQEERPDETDSQGDEEQSIPDKPLDDMDVQAVEAAIPQNVLESLMSNAAVRRSAQSMGRRGRENRGGAKGKPTGARRGELGGRNQIHVVETLRAAAPWQRLRKATGRQQRIAIRKDDIRLRKFKSRQETVTVFVVDASGSQAIHRLAEAKGAVELMLADCYARRDQVALVTFRGTTAEVVLPPTRSLVRTKRALSGVPGGGGTPLASGIEVASSLATAVSCKGRTAQIVLLTDGSANIAQDGQPGRKAAWEDALSAAKDLRAHGISALVIDTSPRGNANARDLADAMGSALIRLPHADAQSVRASVDAALSAA
ncbi:MAG: magnesium chelatase subunit D, partial [Pseudomonadota bacterium]